MKCIFFLFSFYLASCLAAQQQSIDSVIAITKSNVSDTVKINAYFAWDERVYITEPDKSPEINQKIINLAEKNLQKKGLSGKKKNFYVKALADAFNNIGLYYANIGEYLEALEYYEKSRKIGEANKNDEIEARAYMNQGRAMRYSGDLDKAIEYCKKGIKKEEKANKGFASGSSLNLLGNLYRGKGDFPKALLYFQKAMTSSENENNNVDKASALLNFGLVHYELTDYKIANEYYLKSLRAFEDAKYDKGIAVVMINLANIKQLNEDFDSALVYYNKGIIYLQKINDIRSEIGALSNIGIVYNRTGNYTKALEYIQKSYEMRKKLEDKVGMAFSLSQFGEVYINLKQYTKSISFCSEGYNLALQSNSKPEQRDNCNCLYRAHKLNGNTASAFKYFELFVQLRDSLTDADRAGEIVRLEERFKFKKQSEADSIRNLEKEKVQKAETEKQKALAESRDVELKGKKREQYFLFAGLSLVIVFLIILFNRFQTTKKQKKLIEMKERETHEQKQIIEEKQKEIIDSINYARRIQYALLAHDEMLDLNLKNCFVLFKPKDIVSGDFYWATKKGNDFYLAVCDCTGHGVPGAFMSLLNISFLNEAINEKNIEEPHLVLNHVRKRLIENMDGGNDGMDAQLIRFGKNKIQYAAAHNKPILIRGNEIMELQADKMPVGKGEKTDSFTLYEHEICKNDLLIFTTDGFADQFGGAKGKKFKSTNLLKILKESNEKKLPEIKAKLNETFESWKGQLEQIDDVCIIGVRI